MGTIAIRVEGLGKRYQLVTAGVRYGTLGDSLAALARAPLKLFRNGHVSSKRQDFWALRNVSFEVRRGEVLGVIGRNGAGKSTLLKILSSITEPTEGCAQVWGSMGSLLEVGTGFHPELTGRENVFLNGAILGMPRTEVARRFDAIVSFAGIEKFIDMPAKHYSSGMYMRLAFSVAAHMEPEILVIDEVLAVGDSDFQKKCLSKMEQVGSEGRTVLFVSHSMPTILRLCGRALLLEGGRVAADGSPHSVVGTYLRGGSATGTGERVWPDRDIAPGDSVAKLYAVRIRNADGMVIDEVDIRRPFTVEVEYWNMASAVRPFVNLHFFSDEGICLFVTGEYVNPDWARTRREMGLACSICRIPGNFLAEGRVSVLAAVSSFSPTQVHALERDAVAFNVVDQMEGDSVRGPFSGDYPGVVRPLLEWRFAGGVGGSGR